MVYHKRERVREDGRERQKGGEGGREREREGGSEGGRGEREKKNLFQPVV